MKSSETKYTVSNNSSTWGLHSSGTLHSADGQLTPFQDNWLVPSSKVKWSKQVMDCLTLEDGLIGCPEMSATNCYITSQKSKGLIYTMVDDW